MNRRIRSASLQWLFGLVLVFGGLAAATAQDSEPLISMTMRDTELAEVMEMLSRAERVNILLSGDVGGDVSFSLYDVPLSEAIRSIANAAGYAVERRNGTYFIVDRDEAGNYAASDLTELRTIPIQYADPAQMQSMLTPYLSEYGQLTILAESRVLVVEDTPEFVDRIAKLIRDVDRQPMQILIEARILEVTLNAEDSYGIDWTSFFETGGGTGQVGIQGLDGAGNSGSRGLFFEIDRSDVSLMLSALEQDGRIRTLSSPKLLALENEEASVIVGDRRGYSVTTTINQVTTESIEFLESGVILRVTPHVDVDGRIMMEIHPEVSTGVVDANGIPSQSTTEVTTRLLVDSGQTIFVGGLIKQSVSQNRNGVPVLGRIPGLGLLFSSRETTSINTETVVVITPRVVGQTIGPWSTDEASELEKRDQSLRDNARKIESQIDQTFSRTFPSGDTDGLTGGAMKGYTLTELLVVVVLLGLATIMVMPTPAAGNSRKLDLVAMEMANAIRFAQSEAMRTGDSKGVFHQKDFKRFRVFSFDENALPVTFDYDVYHPVEKALYQFEFEQAPYSFSGEIFNSLKYRADCVRNQAFYFDATGVPRCTEPSNVLLELFEITLVQGSESRVISVQGLTGRVTVQ